MRSLVSYMYVYVSYSAGPPYLLERSDMVRVVNTWTTFVPRYIHDINHLYTAHTYILSHIYILVTCMYSILIMLCNIFRSMPYFIIQHIYALLIIHIYTCICTESTSSSLICWRRCMHTVWLLHTSNSHILSCDTS